MADAESLNCPGCGAPLDAPPVNGEVECSFCHHRSRAPSRALATRAGLLEFEAGTARLAASIAERSNAHAEVAARKKSELQRQLRNGNRFMVGFGGVFAAGSAVVGVAAGPAAVVGTGIAAFFGLGMAALGLLAMRQSARDERVRRTGSRGFATVVDYRKRGRKFDLVLKIQLEKREPYEINATKYVDPHEDEITSGARIAVIVNAADDRDFLFDW